MTRFRATYPRKPVEIRQDVTTMRCQVCGLEYKSFKPIIFLGEPLNGPKTITACCPDKQCDGICKEVKI